MSRSIIAAVAGIAAAALIPQMPAVAQEPGIVVSAPRVQPGPWEPKNTVRRDHVVRAHVWVSTADLNLRTRYGQYVLDRRLQMAAYQACNEFRSELVGGVGSMLNPDPGDCRQTAYHNGLRSARYLVWDARRG